MPTVTEDQITAQVQENHFMQLRYSKVTFKDRLCMYIESDVLSVRPGWMQN
jgi:hypothetical protein